MNLHQPAPHDIPQQLPVTMLDLDRTAAVLDMDLPMADACPTCGAFRMCVGDYVCMGQCWPCEEKDEAERAKQRLIDHNNWIWSGL